MKKHLFFTLFFSSFALMASAQIPLLKKIGSLKKGIGDNINQANSSQQKSNSNKSATDSLGFEHRDDSKDSITISYRVLDSTRRNNLDSSIDDFSKYFAVPSTYLCLGNNGAAATSLIFEPNKKIGFDPGFHAFDIYKYTIEGTRFYNTTKSFSSLSYQLASGKEQLLKAGYTKNIKPNFNIGFDYKLITSPGFFITQNTNHNAYRFFGSYQGKRKRYATQFSIVGNNIRASENGGIQDADYLSDPYRKNRFTVPVNLGGLSAYSNNPFVTTVSTGNQQKDFNLFVRQFYDFGKHDSIEINDSTTEYLFYPKLRLQHTFTSSSTAYKYIDIVADSSVYSKWYGMTLNTPVGSLLFQESWKSLKNDFSIIQFPDTKNTSQFFLVGATIQNITGIIKEEKISFYNLCLHGEYRNRTRNKLWDILAKGELYVNGFNSGDYHSSASLSRYFNKRFGEVSLFFMNSNRIPSFIFDNRSAFNLGNNNSYNKENVISFGINSNNTFLNLEFKNHLISNYTYFKNYYQSEQYSKLINLTQLSLSKKIKLTKRWNWSTELTFQQVDLAAPIKVPFVFTRNRLAYEGKFFKNLILSTGVEARYYTAYKAYNYSPVISQFFVQDTVTINNLPDINLFLHFRIKGFAGYLRAENLNAASFQNGFGWINNNFAAPLYPTQGFMIRFGIQWWFVN